jgi:hypothetical protein
MRRAPAFFLAVLWYAACLTNPVSAQNVNGALDFMARITPTAARSEPVRQFTFYVLTKSYAEIAKEVEAQDMPPSREKFIDDLKISPELKEWLTSHDVFDLTMLGLDKLLTPDDIIHVPEFLLAYQRSNSGGVTKGIPIPRYRDLDKTENPPRYEKQHQDYLVALKRFIQTHPNTVSGIELELGAVSPQRKWAQLQGDQKGRVLRLAPDVAQTKYLAGKADTDLEGRAVISGLPAGNYWVSTLSLDVNAGDTRLRWDVPVAIQAGRTTRLELTNLNANDTRGATP